MSVDALSLACNIMTVIDFSHKYYRAYKQIYDDSKADANAQREATELSQSMLKLQKSRKDVSPSLPKDDQLSRVAEQCWEAANGLKQELGKLDIAPTSSRIRKHLRTLKVATLRNWRHDTIEDLKKSLERCESTMQSVVLVEMYASGKARDARLRKDFDTLELRLQNFIDAVSKQETQMSQLFAENRVLHQETQAVVRQELAALNQARVSDAELDRFKASLKFRGFNQRFSEISSGHEKSYDWLLGKPTSSDVSQMEVELIPYHIRKTWKEICGDFSRWLQNDIDSKLYWISGKPGAGKSTLMKFLCRRLKDKQVTAQESYVVLHHFFWLGVSNSRSRQNDMEGFFSTILHQMLELDDSLKMSLVSKLLNELTHLRHKESSTDWSLEDLESSAHAALKALTGKYTVFVLVDALDEHLPSARHDNLLMAIRKLESMPNVRLVVSSRREPIFERHLADCRNLRLEQLTALDIRRFAMGSLKQSVDSNFDSDASTELLKSLVDTIVERADGVFLWARLAIDSVKRGLIDNNTEDQLQERLEDMPTELSDYLASIWKRLGDDKKIYQARAANVFSLILSEAWNSPPWPLINANRMWSSRGRFDGSEPDLLSLSFALAPEDACSFVNEQQHFGTQALLQRTKRCRQMVLSHCAGLVEIVHEEQDTASDGCFDIGAKFPSPDGTCRFIHRTARDFLCETPEGKEILDSNDLGLEGPNYRLLLAFLARSVAFREPGHSVRTCGLMRNLSLQPWLESVLPSAVIGHDFTSGQRNSLLSLCHTIHYRFCGSLENPRFDGWTLMRSAYQVRHFVLEAARYGHLEYANNWIKEQTKSSLTPLSLTMIDAILKMSFEGNLLATIGKLNVRQPTGFRSSVVADDLFPPGLHSQLDMIGSLGQRLPGSCWPPPSLCDDPHSHAPISASRHLRSTTQMITSSVLLCIAASGSPNSRGPEFLPQVLARFFQLLSKYDALQESISGMCITRESCDGHTPIIEIDCPLLCSSFWQKKTDWSRGIIFAFSPLWVIQWAAGSKAAHDGPNEITEHVERFVQSATGNGREVQGPRPIFLATKILFGGRPESHVELKEIKPVPENLQSHLWEPLAVTSPDPEVRESQQKTFLERYKAVCNHRLAKPLKHEKMNDALVSCGIWCSIQENEQFTKACSIRMPAPGAIPVDRTNPGGNPDRIMVPPEGSSDSDEALSYLMMFV